MNNSSSLFPQSPDVDDLHSSGSHLFGAECKEDSLDGHGSDEAVVRKCLALQLPKAEPFHAR